MTNDAGSTRWARELNERDVRLMREKGPGGIYRVTPPPVPWRRGAALALVVAVVFGIGAAIGTGLRALFG